jgi:SAM-dependent methyltransferase
MLEQLQSKRGPEKVLAVVAEGAQLPFPAEHFEVVVVARLLYLTPDWRAILREACRVLASDGCLLHEWGNGEIDEEWVRMREEARRLFETAGLREPFHAGVRTETDVDDQLASLGLVREGQTEIGPGPAITLREFLRRLVEGELSYIWNVPEHVRAECLPRLQRWSEETFDLDRPVPTPRHLRWTIHRKDAA